MEKPQREREGPPPNPATSPEVNACRDTRDWQSQTNHSKEQENKL